MPLRHRCGPARAAHRGGRHLTFTVKSKGELYAALRRRFEDKALRIPADRDLREDLHAVQRNVSAGGTVTYAAPRSEDGHSDRAAALALLIHAAERRGCDFMPIPFRFGKGW